MKISVIGCGRWGTFIAWYLCKVGHEVSLYGKEDSKHFRELKEKGTNGTVSLSPSLSLISDFKEALSSDTIVISIPSQALRSLLTEIRESGVSTEEKRFTLCMKGIEIETGYRLTQVFRSVMGEGAKVAVWLGPGHPKEFVDGIPNCMVIDSEDDALKAELIESFKGPLIRFYYGSDLIGNEIGGAAKNVIGIAAGILDGIGQKSLKGALMSRGTREIARLIKACGGNELSAYGLCHLGDYEATVFSEFSHNRAFGEAFAKGEEFDSLAEGYYTVKALHHLSKKTGVELPICSAVYRLLYEQADLHEEMQNLFCRSLKQEF